MGRKTVRWDELNKKCPKCNSCGIIQIYDWEFGNTYYPYCDCKAGKLREAEYARDTKVFDSKRANSSQGKSQN